MHPETSPRQRAISSILIGDRARQDMGDLRALADSIAQEGLLQPIGITSRNELVFGERRLRACRDILGWSEIEARVVNVSSIVAGEQAENEVRKDFTPSERVAIAEAVQTAVGERRGRPSEEPRPMQEIPDHSPEFNQIDPAQAPALGQETRDFAARRAGFASGKQFERAASVVERGVPELIDKMDAGKISITAAAKVARLPAPKQRDMVSVTDDELKAKLRELAEAQQRHDAKLAHLPTKEEAMAISERTNTSVRANDGKLHNFVPEDESKQLDAWLGMKKHVLALAQPAFPAALFASAADETWLFEFPALIDDAIGYLTETKRKMEERRGAYEIAAE